MLCYTNDKHAQRKHIFRFEADEVRDQATVSPFFLNVQQPNYRIGYIVHIAVISYSLCVKCQQAVNLLPNPAIESANQLTNHIQRPGYYHNALPVLCPV